MGRPKVFVQLLPKGALQAGCALRGRNEMRKIAILGANSAIAESFARVAVERGDALFLVARNESKLAALKSDLEVRGARRVYTELADLDHVDRHASILQLADQHLGGLDTILIAHGILGNDASAQRQYREAEKVFRTNFLSPVSLCTAAAELFEKRRSGTLAVISSVAGDRDIS